MWVFSANEGRLNHFFLPFSSISRHVILYLIEKIKFKNQLIIFFANSVKELLLLENQRNTLGDRSMDDSQ